MALDFVHVHLASPTYRAVRFDGSKEQADEMMQLMASNEQASILYEHDPRHRIIAMVGNKVNYWLHPTYWLLCDASTDPVRFLAVDAYVFDTQYVIE